MKIVISEFMDTAAVDTLKTSFTVVYDPSLVDQPGALHDAIAEADALIVRNRTQVNEALLTKGPRLKVVGRLGVGLDNIDVPQCTERGITVIPATGANSQAVAEYVIGTAMMLLRASYQSTQEVSQGQWPRQALSAGREIHGKTLGLVGFGAIGQLTARLAQVLGMQVIAHDPALKHDADIWRDTHVSPHSLEAVLQHADVVSLHVPLLETTRHLINAQRLQMMKSDAILINTARGGIVDEHALASALREGHLGGAAIDVFDQEPLPAGNIFDGVPRLVLTPHIAGVTHESNIRVSELIADKVAHALTR